MNELREIIGANIAELRSGAKMTQTRLAELLNYSDKAVSKWERGEAVPDVAVLKRIADYFGVTVDYLLSREHPEGVLPSAVVRDVRINRLVAAFISVAIVWLLASVAFAVLLVLESAVLPPWLVYIYAIPVTAAVILIFNSLWGMRRLNFVLLSFLLWCTILSAYLTLLAVWQSNLWVLFIVGIPVQIILLFTPAIRLRGGRKSMSGSDF